MTNQAATDPAATNGAMTGIWFGVDVGSVRVGVARSDPRGVLAVPVATLTRDRLGQDVRELAGLVAEHNAVGVVVGLPRTLANAEGAAAQLARAYGAELASLIAPLPVEFADERMTTVVAQRNLRTSGVAARSQRAFVDQAAAVEILQSYLDRLTGRRAQADHLR